MFLELIATFVAGVGVAGLVLVINRMTRGRLPKWVTPVAAGLVMIAVTVGNEYSWGGRTTAGLPDGVIVIDDIASSSWYKPWTYVWPQTVRLTALDTEAVQSRADHPSVKLADIYLFARWSPPAKVPQLFDCAAAQRANVTEAALIDPTHAAWNAADPRLILEICGSANDV